MGDRSHERGGGGAKAGGQTRAAQVVVNEVDVTTKSELVHEITEVVLAGVTVSGVELTWTNRIHVTCVDSSILQS